MKLPIVLQRGLACMLLFLTVGGCSKKEEVLTDIPTNPSNALYIGKSYQGGIIYYIDNTMHGLIIATADQSTGVKWDNTTGTLIAPGAYSTIDGLGNTNKIMNTLGSGANAAVICKAYQAGAYTDWFLPSSGQLALAYDQTPILYKNISMKPFTANYYWTSTESSSYIAFALCLQMYTGSLVNDFKTIGYPVRAIRAF